MSRWPWLLAALLASGCRMTPDEIRSVQVENELLREQIRTVKENCTYYREIEVRPEGQEESGD